MNITLTIKQLEGLAYATARRNAANPDAKPMTDEEFATDCLGTQCNAFWEERRGERLQKLIPLGEKYDVAPKKVQKGVDDLLEPYVKPARVVTP